MNQDTRDLIDLIVKVATFAVAALAFISSRWNSRTLKGVKHDVDGVKSELVAATAGQNLAEGQLKERDAERAHLDAHTTDSPSRVEVVGEVELVGDRVKKPGE